MATTSAARALFARGGSHPATRHLLTKSSATCGTAVSILHRSCSTMDVPPPKSLQKPLMVPFKLLSGPGPSNAAPRILHASALPVVSHLHEEMHAIMDEIKDGVKYLFQTNNKYTVCVTGSGHAAMEAACCNLVEPGDVVLVAIAGLWGERFAEMVDRHDGDLRKLITDLGKTFSFETIENALKEHKPKLMFITQGESSSTTQQKLDGLGALCHKYNCLLIVDSVAAAGGVPLYMDKWEIDCLYIGSQKVLNVPPGCSPVSFSNAAWEKVQSRKTKVRSFYMDLNWLSNYWGCDEGPRKYHHTGPISSLYALREGLAILAEEGLEASWKRHTACVERFRQGVLDLGLELYVEKPEDRLTVLTGIKVPQGVDAKAVTAYAMKKYLVEIPGGLGPSAGKIWRVGFMGYNATFHNVDLVLKVFKEALEQNPPAKL